MIAEVKAFSRNEPALSAIEGFEQEVQGTMKSF
jgi:hypothetical protein